MIHYIINNAKDKWNLIQRIAFEVEGQGYICYLKVSDVAIKA